MNWRDWAVGLAFLAYLYALGVLFGLFLARLVEWVALLETLPR